MDRKLLKWGNGYGLRLTAAEAKRLGLKAGARVRATVEEAKPRNDWSRLPVFHFGGGYNIKKILEEEAVKKVRGEETA